MQMLSYNVNNKALYLVHEFAFNRMNKDTIHQLADMVMTIFSVNDGSYKYILIDASQVQMLSIELLASELKEVATRHRYEKYFIALVVDECMASEATENLLKTILERKNVELFTSAQKAHLWLTVLM